MKRLRTLFHAKLWKFLLVGVINTLIGTGIVGGRIVSIERDKVGEPFGRLEEETMLRVNRALAVWLGIA